MKGLKSGGRLVANGSFDLDSERARQKLALYQLVDPHRYVLQFVQAAVLSGATAIHVTIDADEVEFEFDGAGFERSDFEDLYLYAFGHRGVTRLDALRHLAVGVIATKAVTPARVELESRGTRLLIRGNKEAITDTKRQRNRIYVREEHREAHIWDFFRNFGSDPAEVVAMADARYATASIFVNGRQISHGIVTPPSRLTVRIENAVDTGYIELKSGGEDVLHLVQNGVLIEEVSLGFGDLPISGVIETRRLATNLSHSAFVRNGAWEDLMDEIVLPAACEAARVFFASVLIEQSLGLVSRAMKSTLLCRRRLEERHRDVPPVLDELLMQLADSPVWRRLVAVDGEQKHVSTRELLASIGEGPVVISTREYETIPLRTEGGQTIEHILLADRRSVPDPRLLASATGRALHDVTPALQEAHSRRARTPSPFGAREGLAVGWPPELDRSAFAHIAGARRRKLHVEIGFPSARIVDTTRFIGIPRKNTVERIERPIDVLRSATVLVFDGAHEAGPASALVRRAAPVVTEAVAAHIFGSPHNRGRPLPPELLASMLEHLAAGTLLEHICDGLGWSSDEIAEVVANPTPTLERLARLAVPAKRSTNRLQALGCSAETALVESVGGLLLTLKELDRGRLDYIHTSSRRRALQIEWELSLVGQRQLLWLDDRLLSILQWVFGPAKLVNYEVSLRNQAARIRRERGGIREEPVLTGLYLKTRKVAGPAFLGEVGLASVMTAEPALELIILHQQKRLAHRMIAIRDGHFRAIVDADDLSPTADSGDVVEDPSYAEICALLTATCAEIFDGWCVHTLQRRFSEEERLALWRAVLRAVRTGDHQQRLEWPVFRSASGDDLSLRELRQRVGEKLVATHNETDAFALLLPVAPRERLLLLAELLPGTELVFNDEMLGMTLERDHEESEEEEAAPAADGAARSGLVGLLRICGIPVDEVEYVEGAAEPSLSDRRALLPREHPLVTRLVGSPEDDRTIWAIAVVLAARKPKWLLHLTQRLAERSSLLAD